MRFTALLLLGILYAAPAGAFNFVVNSNDDMNDGFCDAIHCSLREAITAANVSAGPDLITFDIGSSTITPNDGLPILSDDGTTIRGDGNIRLDGSAIPFPNLHRDGLRIESDFNKVQGLEIHDFPGHGVHINGGINLDLRDIDVAANHNVIGVDGDGVGDDLERNVIHSNGMTGIQIGFRDVIGNVVAGNYVGTNAQGNQAQPNGGSGVNLEWAFDSRVGTNGDGISDDLERNVLSGNEVQGVNIQVGAEDNVVRGNYIGVGADGSTPLGNGSAAVLISNSASNTIGPDNVLSNSPTGVSLLGASHSRIIGNRIGTDATGTQAHGNKVGVLIGINSPGAPAFRNMIGAAILAPGELGPLVEPAGNVIAYSDLQGIWLMRSPIEGLVASENSILFNSIHSNGLLGIDLVPSSCPVDSCFDGATPNDSGDTDFGANLVLNYPVVQAASAADGKTYVQADIVDGLPNTTFDLQFFSNAECDDSLHGEGEVYLGQVTTTTDASGNASTFATLSTPSTPGDLLTATATERGLLDLFPTNTSEFSACVPIFVGGFASTADVLGNLVLSFQRNGSLNRIQARLLADMVNRATSAARQGRPFQAAVHLRVFRLRAGILERRGVLTREELRPLLAASQAALDLLGSDGRDGSRPSHLRR